MGTTGKTHKERQGHCSLQLCLRVLGSSEDSMHFDSQTTVFLWDDINIQRALAALQDKRRDKKGTESGRQPPRLTVPV